MAAVVQTNAPASQRHIIGDLDYRVYSFTGATGDTLQVPMSTILKIDLSAGTLITAITQTRNVGGTSLAFTSSAPMTGETIAITSRVG